MAGEGKTASTALTAPAKKAGRKSLYDPLYAEQARKLCLLGATEEELASFFEVCQATITNWKQQHPAFLASIRDGRIKADAEVADSLYRRATGETIYLEKLMKRDDGTFEAVRYKSYIPGDPSAAYKWLLNRRRKDWTDSTKIDVTGTVNVTINKPAPFA